MACRYPFSPAKVAVTRFFYPSPLSRSTTSLFRPLSCRIRMDSTSRTLASSSSAASEDPKSERAQRLASPNSNNSTSEPGLSLHDASADRIPEAESTSSDQLRMPGTSSSSFPSQPSTNSVSSKNAPFKLSTYSFPSNISVPPEIREHLTEWTKNVLEHSRYVVQEAQKKFVGLGLKVNEMTGYHEVERLKYMVFEKEDELQRLREHARTAKAAYDEAVAARSEAQRETNILLERKHSWTDADVSKFTSLVRSDHTSSHAVASTSIALKDAEVAVDKSFSQLMQVILQRYHEEQVWSDKIRSVSTWANVAGLAINFIIFVGAVLLVEPWKRKRLVEKLEERVTSMMERVDHRLEGVEGHLERVATGLASVSAIKEQHSDAAVQGVEDTPSNSTVNPLGFVSSQTIPLMAAVDPTINGSELLSDPFFTQTIEGFPDYLDPLVKPSQKRDLVVAGMAGAVAVWILMGAVRLVRS
ncbi:mitochondrial inner membrane protein [Cryptococcus neoformans var. grubii Br795]|uniref:Sensitive to high expression protein 9, mitochondrial n=1 Tax=Cryptococcus neoformans Tu259-1 TaxID=1230072 RepID=A0A854Q9H6_CRYNE|nr:mitochondrial inner membrane protein [Cryptococcus neoformans var. grubii 125.91]OXG16583.1 mitochondrial inner membrane protein [Cryptococcus neoformans var. grubii Tu259-1]OXG78909.1 mitochondrial inner membrane protein [Cryptococcus neoformans var. grubii Br795]OXH06426.1 mitochondrial inner membrane protein [Cryptococcus neoformans var. grubii]OXH28015.1 mitochondrial inner membrane protein [Cryptococcus neoformans var. grubii]